MLSLKIVGQTCVLQRFLLFFFLYDCIIQIGREIEISKKIIFAVQTVSICSTKRNRDEFCARHLHERYTRFVFARSIM